MHQHKKVFLCHQCGTIKKLNLDCPQCNEKDSIKFVGPGVERVAEELKEFFPGKNISIMSSDNVNTPNKIKKVAYLGLCFIELVQRLATRRLHSMCCHVSGSVTQVLHTLASRSRGTMPRV